MFSAASHRRIGRVTGHVAWFAVTVGLLACFARPSTAPLDEDELYWIGSAYYYHLAFQRFDWSHADWRLLPARENPPVAKFVLGGGLALTGQRVSSIDLLGTFYLLFERVPGAWGTGEDYAKRERVVQQMNPEYRDSLRRGAQPSIDPTLFITARWTVIVCALVTGFIVFTMSDRMFGTLVGLLASALLMIHPAVVYAYNHALADIIAMMFVSAAAALTAAAVKASVEHTRSHPTMWIANSLLAGILLALACGAKMNALPLWLVAGFMFFAASWTNWHHHRGEVSSPIVGGLLMLAVGFLTFVTLNPAILFDLSGGIVAVFREHQLTEVVQRGFLRDHLDTVGQKIAAVARLSCFSLGAFLLLTAASVYAVLSRNQALRYVGLWYLISAGCVTAWIPFPRSRYVLPLVLPGCILAAAVITHLFSIVKSVFKKPHLRPLRHET